MIPRSVDSSLDSAIVARTSNLLNVPCVKSFMCVRGDFFGCTISPAQIHRVRRKRIKASHYCNEKAQDGLSEGKEKRMKQRTGPCATGTWFSLFLALISSKNRSTE